MQSLQYPIGSCVTADRDKIEFRLFNSSSILWLGKSGVTADREFFLGKTGVTADRDKIEFRLFNSSSILSRSAVTPVFPCIHVFVCMRHQRYDNPFSQEQKVNFGLTKNLSRRL